MKYLIVGLGNIGPEYQNTRHNIGFKVLDAFAKASNAVFEDMRYGAVATVKLKGRTLILLKPNTYMNLSGKAVSYWFKVMLSSSNPYVSFSTSKASARRPRICFCVSVTVRRFENPRSVANARITFMATSELLRTIPKISSVFMMQTMDSSRASADAMCISSAKKAR